MNCSLQDIAKRLKQAKRVAIATHMRPDGDALGSAFSLSCALDFLGIANEVCVESLLPPQLSFIEGFQNVKKYPTSGYDLFVTVDCSEPHRLGILEDTFLSSLRKVDTINIDHHISNTRFAKYNFVRECAANCMNMAQLIAYMGAPLNKKMAEYLAVGLMTDSGNFSHDDVTEETFLLAAKLAKAGVDIRSLNYNLFKKQSKARAALHALVMSGMRYYFDDRFAAIIITKEAMQRTGAGEDMTEGFVDFPLNVDGVEVAASLMEVKFRQYRVSLRTKTYADANAIAGRFGGGGHIRAAGCMLFGELEEVLGKLSFTVSQYLNTD